MKILDIHTHFFHDRPAAMILRKLSAASGFIPCCDGTLSGTRGQMEQAGVGHWVYLPIAVTPAQQEKLNTDAAAFDRSFGGRVIAFGTLHPYAPDLKEEMARILSLGLRGIKLHPQYQQVDIDDPAMERLIRMAAANDMPVIFHAGDDPGLPPPTRAAVEQISRLAERLHDVKDLKLIAAHLGGLYEWDRVEQELCGSELYFDTAMTGGSCPVETYGRIVKKHGASRILFGSDCPWQSPEEALRYLEQLPLTEAEKADICFHNAAGLFPVEDEKLSI